MVCIHMLHTSAMYHKARHIDVRVYHLRELCKDGLVVCKKVETHDQVTDSLTKATLKPTFVKHCNTMFGTPDMDSDA
eukprot:2924280-Rhodomonas_salina.1